jgi:MoaA/NifB/PqqE/SkfB family radical SAM enzyme
MKHPRRPLRLPKKTRDFPKLLHAELHLTNRCNLRCSFCNQKNYRKGRPAELRYDVLAGAITEMKALGLQDVRLSGGGEPTLCRSFAQIIEHLYKHDVALSCLTTNGLLCDSALLDLLFSGRWSGVEFSLPALCEADWKTITSGPPKGFRTIVENIRRLMERRRATRSHSPLVALSVGIHECTYRHLAKGAALARELGVDILSFHTYNHNRYPKKVIAASEAILKQLNDIKAEEETARHPMIVAYSLKDLCLNEVFTEAYALKEDDAAFKCIDYSGGQCFMPWYGTLLRANGDVSICSAYPELPDLGNIHDRPFKAIWFGKEYRQIRSDFERALRSKTSEVTTHSIPLWCTKYAPSDLGCSLRVSRERLLELYR